MLPPTWLATFLFVAIVKGSENETPQNSAGCLTDLLIILDNSGSVREVFEEEKFIALRVAKLLNAEDTQVGIVSFSNHARFASQLKNPIGYTHVLENLENLTGEGEATNTAESLKLAKDELRNVRPNAWKAIILVTDGFSVNSIEELESIMTELSISGVEMFVATASDNYDMRELSIYAGGRPDRVFVRQNLTEIPDAVAQARCRATSKFQSSMGSGEPWDTSTLSSVSNTAPSEFYGGAVAQEWINMMSTTISSMTFPADRTNNGTQLMITDSVGIKEADELTKLQTSTSISNSEITETVSTRHNEITAIPFIPKENSDNGAITIATPKLQDGQKPTGDSIIIVMENSSISTGNFLAESTSTDVAEQSNSTLWLTPFSSATEDISTTNIHLITSSSTISEFGISETPLSNIQNYTDAVGLPESGNSDDATRMKINIEPTMTIIPSPQVGTWIRGVDKVPTLSTSEMNSIGSNSSNSLNSTQLSLVILPTTKQVQYAGDSDSPPISSVSPNPAFPTTKCHWELLIVIDSSESVEEVFGREKSVAIELVESINYHPMRGQITLVYYSDSAVVAQKFTGENTKVDVVAYLNNLHHVGGQTNTESALHLSYEEFRFNCRPEAIRALLIVTDGHSENEVRGLKVEVDKLNSIGVKVFAATVSDNAAYDELKLYSQSGKYFLKNNLTDVNAEVLKVLQPPVCADHQLTDDPNLSLNLKSAMQENTLQPIFGSAITLSKSYGRRSDPTSEINKSLINEKN